MAIDADSEQWARLFLKPVENRHMTDRFFIILLPVNLLLCLGIALNVLQDERVFAQICDYFRRSLLECSVYGLVVTVLIILSVVTLNMLKAEWLVFVVTFSIVITISTFSAYIFWQLLIISELELHWFLFISSAICIIYFIYDVTIFICTREFGVATLGSMIREPIRAILHSHTVSLFSFAIIFLVLILGAITFPTAMSAADFIFEIDNEPLFLIRLRFFTFVLGGIFIIDFTCNYGFMVVGDYFANYYGRHNVSKTYILQSIATVTRYHLGTVAFLSTPILPRACASIIAFKNDQQSGKQCEYKLINFISKLSLIVNMPEYALIQTSVFGSKSLTSIKQMVDLRHNNSLLFLTLNAVSLKIMDFSMIIALIIGLIVVLFGEMGAYVGSPLITSSKNHEIRLMLQYFMLYYPIWFYVKSINMLLLRPAACTFSIHKMIYDQHDSTTSGARTELTSNNY